MRTSQYVLLLFFFTIVNVSETFSQVKNYEAEWKRVDELLKARRLPQSALAEVKKIYAQAKKEGQQAQIVKAVIYMTSLQQETRESATERAIDEVEKEILLSKPPATQLLQSYLANLYWQYFQANRWRIYDRTATTAFNKQDIATWSADDFHQKIAALYQQSLQPKTLLQQTGLQHYDAIIDKGNVRHLRPTLYDLLAHRALQYFKSGDRDLNKPAYAFEITSPQAFAPAAQFIKTTFTTRDTASLQYKALLLYQDLIRFHLADKNPAALIDVDIDRIQHVYQTSVAEAKDSLYVQALQHLTQQYSQAAAAEAWYLLAAHYDQLAGNYQPLQDTTYRYDRLKAKEILERIVKDSTQKSEAWANSYNLLRQINAPQFSFQLEKVSVPDAPFRALVTYKNVPQIYFRIVRATAVLSSEQSSIDEKYWNALLAAPVLKSWQQPLPQTGDLQQHATEVKIDALPSGKYILVGSADAAFSKKDALLGAQSFYVSNISYINQNNHYFVLHRQTGQPLAGAIVRASRQEYDYRTSKYAMVSAGTYTVDKNGYFALRDTSAKTHGYTYYLDLLYKGDSLNMSNGQYHSYTPKSEMEKETKKIFFFTDRSIYRPGQTVYFKGIVINEKGKDKAPDRSYTSVIYLNNANYESIDSILVNSNEFGSFSGKFTLPQSGLNGQFRIFDKERLSEAPFSVEEYKRPKFSVQYDTLKTDFKLFDSVTVQGRAQAYAGNNISGAQVSYRVVRQPRFLYPWLFRRGWWPRTQPMEIASGTTTTDASGNFNITFKAIPDLKVDKKLNPFFDYHIYADVTDLNGETRSAEQVVTIGYQSLILNASIPDKIAQDSLSRLFIRTQNQSGIFQPATVQVSVTSLVPEQRLIRSRFWQQPDQFVMSKEEYIRHFPHDEYSNESDMRNWQRGATVLQHSDSTRTNGAFVLPQKLTPGFYEISISTRDKEGNDIKSVHYVEVFDARQQTGAKPQYLWAHSTNTTIEPGQKATVQIATAADSVFLVQQVEKPSEKNVANLFSFNQLQKEKQTFSFGANEGDRGGYGVTFFFIKHNRLHQYNPTINVPWTNKELDVTYTTFRDKTLPGAEEKWTVKISGAKNDKVAAEVLASMYDASLDLFQQHQWYKPGIWPVYARLFTWNGTNNFTAVTSYQKWWRDEGYKSISKIYDELEFDVYEHAPIRLRGVATVKGREVAAQRREASDMMLDSTAPAANVSGKATGINVQDAALEEAAITAYGGDPEKEEALNMQDIPVRTNFNETAFFFPHLQTDKDGNVSFSFSAPEALTRWKLQTLAHTGGLSFGMDTREMVTQKELMVQPNMPRFLRQGDRSELVIKVSNLSDKELTGQVQLLLIDAETGQSVDGWFQNIFPNQYFTVAPGSSEAVKFPVEVPYLYNKALTWRVVARSGKYSDGEEAIVPVLTNKMLVTETMTLPMQGSGTKSFVFEKLLNTTSETLQNHALTVEYTANPAWLAVQALPYLTEGNNENAERVWNRYYANALASMLVQTAPRLKAVFETWKIKDTAALLSNLQKNESLKSILLQETPWVLAAKNEAQQKQNIALLFDAVRMSSELKSSLEKLKGMQKENGGFVWYEGGPEDRYMTQYIITGIGHLQHLKGDEKQNAELNTIVKKALAYLDRKVKEDYDALIKRKADLKKQLPGYIHVQYLYMRSFFQNMPVATIAKTAYDFYRRQAQQTWKSQSKYMQAMTALALHRTADLQTPKDILRSLKETAIVHEELGMYWKEVGFGINPYWWSAPVETQALMIEAFSEINRDITAVNALRTWLVKNKQTTNWRTSKATAEACYALLLQGTDWISSEPAVSIQLGNTGVNNRDEKSEAGTGYFTKTFDGPFVKPEMGQIKVQVQQTGIGESQQPSWGAVYWQYFEDLDKITKAATPLQLNKKLFIEKKGDRGPVLTPVGEGQPLKVGDKVTVRIELKADRDMEYVHLKDLRASALEPVDVISGYQWQGGLGYYQTVKDASANFFIHYLPKGTYVFEYSLFVTHSGNFSNGVTTIQSMYAPEFSAHSEGVRITVDEQP